jgi:hypothetical protein
MNQNSPMGDFGYPVLTMIEIRRIIVDPAVPTMIISILRILSIVSFHLSAQTASCVSI